MEIEVVETTKTEDVEEGKVKAKTKLKGRLSELINSNMVCTYQKPGANPNEMEDVSAAGTLGHIFRDYGLSGPGQTEPEFELGLTVEEALEEVETPDEIEDLPWGDLTEISGIGDKTKEKIKDVLIGGKAGG